MYYNIYLYFKCSRRQRDKSAVPRGGTVAALCTRGGSTRTGGRCWRHSDSIGGSFTVPLFPYSQPSMDLFVLIRCNSQMPFDRQHHLQLQRNIINLALLVVEIHQR
jgi:hypothetical protein